MKLPNLATIGTLDYTLFENNYDHPDQCWDLVKCNNCIRYGLIQTCDDDCPDCGFIGGLMDLDISEVAQ